MSGYQNGVVAVAATATKIATVSGTSPENGGIVIQNQDASNAVYLGGSTGTTSTGVKLAAGATLTVPSTGSAGHSLYGIVATGTVNVAFLHP
jgi:hypothetical protein